MKKVVLAIALLLGFSLFVYVAQSKTNLGTEVISNSVPTLPERIKNGERRFIIMVRNPTEAVSAGNLYSPLVARYKGLEIVIVQMCRDYSLVDCTDMTFNKEYESFRLMPKGCILGASFSCPLFRDKNTQPWRLSPNYCVEPCSRF